MLGGYARPATMSGKPKSAKELLEDKDALFVEKESRHKLKHRIELQMDVL
jgi:hypothetical protein